MTERKSSGDWGNVFVSGIVTGAVFAIARANLEGGIAFLVPAFAFAFFIQNTSFRFSVIQKIAATGLMFVIGMYWYAIGQELLQHEQNPLPPKKDDTALIYILGDITHDSPSSADNIIASLRTAYSEHSNKGVIILLNSTGGSMVEAGNIHDEIMRLRLKYPAIPLYAVIKDVCTSACYYVAVAADYIYVNSASLVGSIGATMITSHINDAIKKSKSEYGYIEHTDNIKQIQNNIHKNVVNAVRMGRGMRLTKSNKIFSGLSWDGEMAIRLGLADSFGSELYIAREIIGAENIVKYSPPKSRAN